MSEGAAPAEPRQPGAPSSLRCTPFADAFYFCFSPVHQLSELRREGGLDDCAGAWADLRDCLSLKAGTGKGDAPTRARLEAKTAQPCWWKTRSAEEAADAWVRSGGWGRRCRG